QRDSKGQVTIYIDARSFTTTYEYSYGSGKGDLTEVNRPDGGTTRYTYDSTHHRVTQQIVSDDAANHRTTNYAYSSGDLTSSIDPLTATTTYAWSSGLMTEMVEPGARTTLYGYSSRRLTSTIDPSTATTLYAYDAAGNPSTVIEPGARTTQT